MNATSRSGEGRLVKGRNLHINNGDRSTTYQVRMDDTDIRVVTSQEGRGKIGDPAWISFETEKIRFFSDETGNRIAYTSEQRVMG